MLLQQAGSLLEGSAVIFRVAGNYNQIVVFCIQTWQKHVDGSVDGAKRGLCLVGKPIKQRTNQRNALGRGINRRKLTGIIQTVDQLQRFHHGTGADGNHRCRIHHMHEHAQQLGLGC